MIIRMPKAIGWKYLFWFGMAVAFITDMFGSSNGVPLYIIGWLVGLYTMSMWHDRNYKTGPNKSIKRRKTKPKQNEAPKKRKR